MAAQGSRAASGRMWNSGAFDHPLANQEGRPIDVAIRCIAMQTVASGSGGPIPTNSTVVVPFRNAERRRSSTLEIPNHCGKGHPLTPNNVRLDQGESRWRCRQCGRERRRISGAAEPAA